MGFKQVFGRFLIITFVFVSGIDKFLNTQVEAEKLAYEIKLLYDHYDGHWLIFHIPIKLVEAQAFNIVLTEGVALIVGCLLFFINHRLGGMIISFMFLMCNLIDHNYNLYSGNELRIHVQLSLLNLFVVAGTLMAGHNPRCKKVKKS